MIKNNKGSIKKILIPIICLLVCIIAIIIVLNITNKGIKKYSISFETNGGTLIENYSVDENSTITKPEDPVKENYEFAGWYYNDELFDFNSKITENVILEAKWIEKNNDSAQKENTTNTQNKPSEKLENVVDNTPNNNENVEDNEVENEKNEEDENLNENTNYTITFKDEDGTTLSEEQIVKYGSLAVEPEEPTKEEYVFQGWYNGEQKYDFTKAVKENINLIAKWKINTYTITFVNYDGTVLETRTEEYGKVPTYTGENPTKPADEQYTYIFAGWRPNLTIVERDTEYIAKFKEELNKYTVVFKDEDGTILSEEQVIEYGNIVTKPEEPTKVGHKFIGWFNGETEYNFTDEVTTNITLTAKWEKEKYTVTFVNYDGTYLEEKTVEYGVIPTYTSEVPTKVSDNVYEYSFTGWDKELVAVTEDVTYTAIFEESYVEYEIKFVNDDGTELSTNIYHYGDTVIEPETPIKEADAQYTYTFAGWTPNIISVENDATYTAIYTKATNSYTVKFVDEDGTILSEEQVIEYGNIVTKPEEPTKPGCKFQAWYNGETEYNFTDEVTTNITLTAKWEKETYTVTFVNYDGTVLEEKTEEYGTVPTYTGENPTKAGDNVYEYTFVKWDKELEEVTENVTYTATFDKIYVEYEIKFVNEDGTEISKTTYHYGDEVVVPENPVKEADAQYTYTFAGWNPSIKDVRRDETYTATYTKTTNSYTVKFISEDGRDLAQEQVIEYGSLAKEPEEPERVGHKFIGWYNGEVKYGFREAVTENTTLTAKWEKEKFTVTFVNYDGTVLEEKTEEYGTIPTYTAEIPTKVSDNVYEYLFIGWDKELVAVTGNVTYTATFNKTYVEYEIKFVNEDGTEISKKTYHYGDEVEVPENPEKEADAQYTYTFAGWTPNIISVENDVTYTATYTKTTNSYTVVFVDEDGTTLAENQTVEYGKMADEPQEPTKVGHIFRGWYNGVTKYEFKENITENVTLTAKWEKEKFTITFVNYDGTVLEEKVEEYGVVPTYTEETPEQESDTDYEYMFIGWTPSITQVDKDATYTATFKYLVDADKEVRNAIGEITSGKFHAVKARKNLNVKFTSYTTTNIYGDTVTKEPPYKFTELFNDVLDLFYSLSSNETYESFELYYKHEDDETGMAIDLKDYDLTDTSLGSWYGDGANDKVGDWIGYLATGTASTMSAYGANSDDLIGKTITGTIKLKDEYVLEDGTDEVVYYITFTE